jgi:hypothetical protein
MEGPFHAEHPQSLGIVGHVHNNVLGEGPGSAELFEGRLLDSLLRTTRLNSLMTAAGDFASGHATAFSASEFLDVLIASCDRHIDSASALEDAVEQLPKTSERLALLLSELLIRVHLLPDLRRAIKSGFHTSDLSLIGGCPDLDLGDGFLV